MQGWSCVPGRSVRGVRGVVAGLLAGMSSGVLALSWAPAPYLNFFAGNAPGDIIMNSVMVPNAPTVSTYYMTSGWNWGSEAGGYTGIQWTTENYNAAGGPVYIFSIWDPISSSKPIVASYTDAGTQTRRFGGEGTGLNSMNWTLGWKANTWYTTLVRNWDCGSKTCFGHWIRNEETGVWTHNITMDFPIGGIRFAPYTPTFLEDWSQNGLMRSAHFRNFWRRDINRVWVPGSTAQFSVSENAETMPFAYDASVTGDTFFMRAGAGVKATIKPGDQLVATGMPAAPVLTTGEIGELFLVPQSAARTVDVSWTPVPTRSPQFAYRTTITSLAGVVSHDEETVLPQGRKATLKYPAEGQHLIAVQTRDIFDQLSVPRYALVGPPGVDPAQPRQLMFERTAHAVTERAGSVTVMVHRLGNLSAAQTVDFATVPGTAREGLDYQRTTGTLRWEAFDNYPKAITVPIVDDTTPETSATFTIALSKAGTAQIVGAAATVTIVDDDAAPFDITQALTVASNPYGALTVNGGTLTGSKLQPTQSVMEIQLGPNPGTAGGALVIEAASLRVGPGNVIVVRGGAVNQRVVFRTRGNPGVTLEGVIVASGGALAPVLQFDVPGGMNVGLAGLARGEGGLEVRGDSTAATGPLVNDGTLHGAARLFLRTASINGHGAFVGDEVTLASTGHVNNPSHGSHFMSNHIRVSPAGLVPVRLRLADDGTARQVFNVLVTGDAIASMPSQWPAGSGLPPNNLPVLPGGVRAAGEPEPAYGGGSLLLQVVGRLWLEAGASGDFVFPGGLVMRARQAIEFGGVTVDNGWTTAGVPFSGQFFEAPTIRNSSGEMRLFTNALNWINFSSYPQGVVRASQLVQDGNGDARFVGAMEALHVNTYSTQVEAAADGYCWICYVNTPALPMP